MFNDRSLKHLLSRFGVGGGGGGGGGGAELTIL